MVLSQAIFFIPFFHLSYLKYHSRRKSPPECWYIHKKHPSINAAFNTSKLKKQKCFWQLVQRTRNIFQVTVLLPLPPSHGSSAIFIPLLFGPSGCSALQLQNPPANPRQFCFCHLSIPSLLVKRICSVSWKGLSPLCLFATLQTGIPGGSC